MTIIQLRTFKTQTDISKKKFTDSSGTWILSTISTKLVRPTLATYPSLCITCVTYRTPHHAIGHQVLPTRTCYRKCWEFERAFFILRGFLPCTPSCCFQGFPGSGQFNLKVSRVSCWSSKHCPGPAICLNHSDQQKFYTGRFYLRARAGQLRNINLYEMFASCGVWTLFTVDEYDTRHTFYPFGYRALQSVINFS